MAGGDGRRRVEGKNVWIVMVESEFEVGRGGRSRVGENGWWEMGSILYFVR